VTHHLSFLHLQFPSLLFPIHRMKMFQSLPTHHQQWSKVHSLLHSLKKENTVAQQLIPHQSRVETTRTVCPMIQLKFHSTRGSTCSSSRTRKNIIITSSKLKRFDPLYIQFLKVNSRSTARVPAATWPATFQNEARAANLRLWS